MTESKNFNVICETCRYFNTDDNNCQRFPHSFIVSLDHWCGEWDYNRQLDGKKILYRDRCGYPPEKDK